nr:MAG TPA: hypothetical protein [Bacteriophage sp.]
MSTMQLIQNYSSPGTMIWNNFLSLSQSHIFN